MEKEAYDNLLKEFEQGTCVLVLGPEFFMLQNGEESLVQNLRDIIYSKREKLKDKPYLSEDGFFYVNKTSIQRNTILYDIQDFYKNQEIPDYYQKLSELPFKLVINLSPDDYLSKVLHKSNRNHEFLFYKNGLHRRIFNQDTGKTYSEPVKNIEDLGAPSFDCPWIFNFVGIFQDKDSMIFTFDSLFEFLYSVFPISNMPDKLKLEIQQAGTFLFMGFDYNKWYLKMIFFILHKICESTGVQKTAVFNYDDIHLGAVNFFQSQFNINFHRESALTFLMKLHEDSSLKITPTGKSAIKKTNNAKTTILYLTSSPTDVMPLRFDKEFKIIELCHRKKDQRAKFDLKLQSIKYREMLPVIDEINPSLLIFSMHGDENSRLLFESDNHETDHLTTDELSKDIQTLKKNKKFDVQCIIFSSCNSDKFAKKMIDYIPYSIGVQGPVPEEVMFEFCEGFFESFFNSADHDSAFEMGIRFVERKSQFRMFTSKIKLYSHSNELIEKPLQISL